MLQLYLQQQVILKCCAKDLNTNVRHTFQDFIVTRKSPSAEENVKESKVYECFRKTLSLDQVLLIILLTPQVWFSPAVISYWARTAGPPTQSQEALVLRWNGLIVNRPVAQLIPAGVKEGRGGEVATKAVCLCLGMGLPGLSSLLESYFTHAHTCMPMNDHSANNHTQLLPECEGRSSVVHVWDKWGLFVERSQWQRVIVLQDVTWKSHRKCFSPW